MQNSSVFSFPPVRLVWNAGMMVDPTLVLCTRYPLLLGGQCRFKYYLRLVTLDQCCGNQKFISALSTCFKIPFIHPSIHSFILLFISDAFTEKIPKSPVRELLEMEPETAKFEWVKFIAGDLMLSALLAEIPGITQVRSSTGQPIQ